MQSLSVFMRKCTTSKKTNRRVLSYAWKDKDGTIWAADGYRMHVDKLHPDYETVTDFDYEAHEGLRGLKIVDVNSDLKKYGAMAETLRTKDSVPPFEEIIPKNPTASASVYVEDLRNAVKCTKPFNKSGSTRIIYLRFKITDPNTPDTVEVYAKNGKGDISTTVEANIGGYFGKYDGNLECRMVVSPGHLEDALLGVKGLDDKTTLQLTHSERPLIVGDTDKRYAVIMPMSR